jgi:hypothetical protein
VAIYLGGGSDNNSYYDNSSHNFRDRNATLHSYITAAGIWAGSFTDFNNTAYYLDPANNSVLNALYLRNGSGVEALAANTSSFGYSSSYRAVILGNQYLTTISLGYDPISNLSGSFNGQGEGREVLFRNGVNFMTPNSANNNYLYPLTLADGYSASSGSFRAPIFYDTDNTAYYVNPQGGTVLGGQVSFAGGSYVATNGDFYARRDSAETGVYYFADGGSKYLYWSGGSYIFGSAGPVSNAVYFAAPIFYDSDNSGYYIDAASTSVLNTLMVATGVGAYDSSNDPYGKISVTRNTDANYSYYGLTRAGQLGMGMGIDTSNRFWIGTTSAGYNGTLNAAWFTINNSGQVAALGDFRAPLFYDTNDTAYYLNPNGGSRLGTMTIDGMYSYGGITTDGSLTVGFNSVASYIYMSDTDEGPRVIHCNSNQIGFLTQVGGWGAFCTDDGGWYSNTAMYAPIYYDLNNSAYYVDPNGSSRTGLINADNLRTQNDVYIDQQYGSSLVGVYSSYRYQGVFAMGDSYKLTADGTTTGSLYGIAWSHPNAGGTATNLNTHGALILENGNFLAALSGSIRSRDDMRTPIFYDIANTGYYLNLNGASKLATLTLDGMLLLSDLNIGGNLTVGVDQVFSNIFMTDTDDGVRIIHCNSNRIGFLTEGSAWGAYCTDNGTWISDVAMQSPIYYDLNNTGFYVDPNSTSNLSALSVNGGPVYRSDWTNRFQSQSDFVDGTLVSTDIPATASAGESFIIEITGKSYDGSNPPFKVVAQGYLYNDTIINFSGINYGGNFSSYVRVFQDGGVLKFWWPRISYWNSFNVNVMAMDGQTNNTITRNRVSTISNSTEPTGTKKVTINLVQSLRQNVWQGNTYFGSDGAIYGTVFYDTNNGAYYADPASNSNLYSLTLSGNTYFQPNSWIQFNGSYGLYWPNSNGAHIEGNTSGSYTQLGLRGQKGGYGGLFDLYSSVNGIMYDGAGNGGVYREPNGRWYFYHNVANDCTGFGTSTTVSGYNIYVPTGLRSDGRVDGSLFYDVSNTAFYLDPNATGTSLNVAGAIIAAGNVTAYSDIRVKDNIETVENALAKVAAIRGVTYTRKDLDDKERRYAGVIAQEVEQVLPEAVGGDEHRKTVDYNGTIALLIEAVKELTSEVETLKAAIRSK